MLAAVTGNGWSFEAATSIEGAEGVLTPQALDFVAELQRTFDARRRRLLAHRVRRSAVLRAGELPGFLPETFDVRTSEWRVAATPADLQDRRVEITGPVDRKMMINALNSGASCFMADFEDSLSPTWQNVIAGQVNLKDAVYGTLEFDDGKGKSYRLDDDTATLLVRPRGWHLEEANFLVDGRPVSASLFDFGLFFFHNAEALLERGTGPYFYLPKLENHREARLWNDVFCSAQRTLGIPHGSIRATVLIETILAAFEMDEILFELRDHSAGLNAGRWDYIFSVIKKFRTDRESMLPDRAQVTMTVPFMRAYTQLLVRTCHRRGAHAIGGMAAFIPSRRDPAVNEVALAGVREDKERETADGFDGTWVAHPDLVPVAREVFEARLGDRPHQRERLGESVATTASELLAFGIEEGRVTREGAEINVSVALQYLAAWIRGTGAAAINHLMEDTATAEISRAQLWQWLRHGARLDSGGRFTAGLYQEIRDAELHRLMETAAGSEVSSSLAAAAELLDELVLEDGFTSFLTLKAYPRLDAPRIARKAS